MFAIVKTGGKQYRVAENDVITVERLQGEAGDTVAFEEVLLVGDDKKTETGAPLVSGATVAGEILEQARGDKVLIFKKKRRKTYRRTRGHRQDLSVVRITEILTGGKKPSGKKAAAPKAAPKTSEEKPAEAKAESKAAPKDEAKTETKTAESKGSEKKTAAKKPAAKKTEGKKAETKSASAKSGSAKKAPAKKTAAKKKADDGKKE